MKCRSVMGALIACAVAMTAGVAFAEGDAAKGKKVFNKCKACHTLEAGKKKIGPDLAGIIGRTAGSVEGFKYSDAMKSSGVVWTEENIDAYLEKPKEFMPKNKMVFVGLKKAKDRANVIEFLKQEAQ